MSLAPADWAALGFFLLVWAAFTYASDGRLFSRESLSMAMNRQREKWIRVMASRELRMIDTSIMLSLQQGTAFFASSSLLALGGCFALLGTPDAALSILDDLPYAGGRSRELFELKMLGLVSVLAYAFFKFGWAYRLFNYCSILIGAVPTTHEIAHSPGIADRAIERAAAMNILAGKHFSAGLRGVFFSVAYLGWFVHPIAFGLSTLILLAVLTRRQFFSAARLAVLDDADGQAGSGRSVAVRPVSQ
jgi:uncharacterized membrane protein